MLTLAFRVPVLQGSVGALSVFSGLPAWVHVAALPCGECLTQGIVQCPLLASLHSYPFIGGSDNASHLGLWRGQGELMHRVLRTAPGTSK